MWYTDSHSICQKELWQIKYQSAVLSWCSSTHKGKGLYCFLGPWTPAQGPVGLSKLAQNGKFLLAIHAQRPEHKQSHYKISPLQTIFSENTCTCFSAMLHFLRWLHAYAREWHVAKASGLPAGVSIVLIMKEKKFLFLPLEGKSHSQIKCMIWLPLL